MTSCDDGIVMFRFYRPDAAVVKVLGTFNGWAGDSLQMTSDGDGWWSLQVELPDGEYRFRYMADGHWFTDFAANGVENRRNGWNSILVVPERRRAKAELNEKETNKLRLQQNDNEDRLSIAA